MDKSILNPEEARLVARIETLVRGQVVRIDRQVRWRPSWFVDVQTPQGIEKIYVRGDRESDVVPFPELKREADIIRVLGEQGIPAPKIYGMCEDPVAIVMQAVPGTRDVVEAASDAERRSVARQYIDALAAMHQLSVEPFAAIGLTIPQGAEAISLAGLQAYMPLYKKNKVAPDPLIEFAIRWLTTNIPMHRVKPSVVAFDAGQFLFDQGKITALYDLEFAMVGDPMVDIATMAMRDSYEPTGERMSALIDYYGQVTGEPVDIDLVRYHHVAFATCACMQFAGAIKNPQAGDPHDVYIEWDLALRRTLLNALARRLNIDFQTPELLPSQKRYPQAALDMMLQDQLSQLSTDTPLQQSAKKSLQRLLEYAAALNTYQPQLDQLALTEAEMFVGKCADVNTLESQLELFVQQADALLDEPLLQYFSRQLSRRISACSEIAIGLSAQHIQDDILS